MFHFFQDKTMIHHKNWTFFKNLEDDDNGKEYSNYFKVLIQVCNLLFYKIQFCNLDKIFKIPLI